MQPHRSRIRAAHRRDFLPGLHVLTVVHQHGVIMRIRSDVVLTVLNHDEITIAPQLITDVNHLPGSGGINRCTARSRDINAFIAAVRG